MRIGWRILPFSGFIKGNKKEIVFSIIGTKLNLHPIVWEWKTSDAFQHKCLSYPQAY